jgi:hypothetical protein
MTIRTAGAAALAVASIGLAATAGTITLRASDPVGVYAVVQKVVLEPSDSQPQRIQVWGAFALSEAGNNDDYAAPQVGYVYYTCPQGQEQTCRNEWADIKSVAGKDAGVGFGGRRAGNGRVRKATEAPGAPDVYPIRMGVTKMSANTYHTGIVSKLKTALSTKSGS